MTDRHADDHVSWTEAAIEAEYETGQHETSEQQARSHVLVRLARMTLGFLVLAAGIVAMIGPGPGVLIVAAGLGILARDVAWADRLLQRIRHRIPSDADGKIPRSTIVTMVLVTASFLALSAWWTFLR